MAKNPKVIGRSDIVDLPEFGLSNIDAKIDTGAYTSAINCSRVRESNAGGVKTLTFYLSGTRIHERRARKFSTTSFKRKRIRSSNGTIEERYVVKSVITLFGRRYKTEFSLSDRSKMQFPLLLGRRLLAEKFVVDVTKKNLSYKMKLSKS